MNAEERAIFVKRKLEEQWPGLNGCDSIEILLDEPEIVIVQVILHQEFEGKLKESKKYISILFKESERIEDKFDKEIRKLEDSISNIETNNLKKFNSIFEWQASTIKEFNNFREEILIYIRELQVCNSNLESKLSSEILLLKDQLFNLKDQLFNLGNSLNGSNLVINSLKDRLLLLEGIPLGLSSRFFRWFGNIKWFWKKKGLKYGE